MKFSHHFHAALMLAAATIISTASAADMKVSAGDKLFVEKAAQGGMTEVKLGELASKDAGTADIKAFGTMMVTDHSKANAELKEIATKQGLTVPAELDKKHAMMVAMLSKLSGKAFDEKYVPGMVTGHETTIALFESEVKDGQNAALKAFAEKTLPTIKMHLKHILAIQKSM